MNGMMEWPTGRNADDMGSGPVPMLRQTASISLLEVEDTLAALLNSEGDVPPELEQQWELEVQQSLAVAVDKRERVAKFIITCKQAAEVCGLEIARIRAQQTRWENLATRVKAYVLGWLETQPVDESGPRKGKLPILRGHTTSMYAQGIAAKLQYDDAEKIPNAFKRVEVKMSFEQWRALYEAGGSYAPKEGDFKIAFELDNAKIKAHMAAWDGKGENPVPGCDLIIGRHTLVVE